MLYFNLLVHRTLPLWEFDNKFPIVQIQFNFVLLHLREGNRNYYGCSLAILEFHKGFYLK